MKGPCTQTDCFKTLHSQLILGWGMDRQGIWERQVILGRWEWFNRCGRPWNECPCGWWLLPVSWRYKRHCWCRWINEVGWEWLEDWWGIVQSHKMVQECMCHSIHCSADGLVVPFCAIWGIDNEIKGQVNQLVPLGDLVSRVHEQLCVSYVAFIQSWSYSSNRQGSWSFIHTTQPWPLATSLMWSSYTHIYI